MMIELKSKKLLGKTTLLKCAILSFLFWKDIGPLKGPSLESPGNYMY